jgi:CheY-like chemotaxis protein
VVAPAKVVEGHFLDGRSTIIQCHQIETPPDYSIRSRTEIHRRQILNNESSVAAPARPRMLVADDESIIRRRLQELGENLGFTTKTAKDGLEAWEMFQEERPDLAILDIYMPRMNGLTVLARIKESDPALPVILITGFMHYEQLVLSGGSVRPDGCIIKPLNSTQTAQLILNLTQQRLEKYAEVDFNAAV